MQARGFKKTCINNKVFKGFQVIIKTQFPLWRK